MIENAGILKTLVDFSMGSRVNYHTERFIFF